MFTAHLGEFAALFTAVCWTASSMSFEVASKQVGSTVVNLLKLCLAFLMLAVYSLIARGRPLPTDATLHNWVWLALSGLAGFVVGDLFLFRAFTIIGSRVSMLIMATSPLLTAFIGWVFLGEQLTGLTLLGMGLTVVGIAVVVLERNPGEGQIKFTYAPLGILLAFGGAAGQAIGITLSKYGMGSYDAVAATQIRQVAGAAGLFVVALAFHNLGRVRPALQEWRTFRPLLIGSAVGPALGVSLSLLAVQHTSAAVASTLMATPPVLIIPAAILVFKEKVTAKEAVGALVAVVGAGLLFL
jgi:drug/metabolite transporter (DMT)-like permease